MGLGALPKLRNGAVTQKRQLFVGTTAGIVMLISKLTEVCSHTKMETIRGGHKDRNCINNQLTLGTVQSHKKWSYSWGTKAEIVLLISKLPLLLKKGNGQLVRGQCGQAGCMAWRG